MKKKTVTKRIVDLTASFLAVASILIVNDLTGYSLFDQEDGGNIACDLDPTCRKLTEGEIKLAHKYFGNQLNYKSINLFSRPPVFSKIDPNVLAVSSFGNIFFIDDSTKTSDFSAEKSLVPGIFLHEMTHVWQYQDRSLVEYFLEIKKQGTSSEQSYQFDIDEHPKFKDFGFEQQAEIIRSTYTKHTFLKTIPPQGSLTLQYYCAQLEKLEEKARQEFPIEPFKACVLYKQSLN